MKYSFYIGRFQPLHDGHKAIIRGMLEEGKNVCVAIMNTDKSEKNPYGWWERVQMIKEAFGSQVESGRIKIEKIPAIDEVVYGRTVGYDIRQVHLSKELESISATKIRRQPEFCDCPEQVESDVYFDGKYGLVGNPRCRLCGKIERSLYKGGK